MQEITSSKSYDTKDRIWKLCAWRDLMARIHDDSLKYVLSEKAIVALTAKFPKEPIEVYDVIAEADLSHDSSSINLSLPSPSPVVISHLNELCRLLQEMNAYLDDEFMKSFQKHLPAGCCPLSIYNSAISCEFSLKGKSILFSKQSGGRLETPVGRKTSCELFDQKYLCQSPVYHNCRIYTSDGQLLCHCSRKRMQWYLRQDLAKLVETDPPAIMLLFEPKRHPNFYVPSKKNICVGCGEKNHYERYRVIPSCYRIHLPEHLKSRRSVDIVLLCVNCHAIADSAAEKYKKQIANEYKIPLFVRKIVDSAENKGIATAAKSVCEVEQEGVSPMRLRIAAATLLRHGSIMPLERRSEHMQIVRKYFGGREISSQDLEMAIRVGMSPHERRKFEKKRGLHFKHSERSAILKISKSSCPDTTESGINVNVKSHESLTNTDVDVGGRNASISDLDCVLSEVGISPADSNEQQYLTRKEPERGIAFSSDSLNGNGDQTDGTSNSSPPFLPRHVSTKSFENVSLSGPRHVSSKSFENVSLSGHGPHGKQVVEHLLHTAGEEGLNQFCQRWRQVFVEAIHPRFLPSDWDVSTGSLYL